MMTEMSAGAHLDDGELMVLDGDASVSDAAQREHLASCARCAERLRVLREHSRRVSSLIAEIDLPAGFRSPSLPAELNVRTIRPWWTQQGWRRAAAVLFVIGALAAVPPVRAWTVGWVKRQVAALTGADHRDTSVGTSAVTQPTPQAPAIDSGATLWFDVEGPELTVEFAHSQASGTLTLLPSTRATTGFEVVNGASE